MSEALTLDRFLGGRVLAKQPARGFRAGHDTVLLAAAVSAQTGDKILELGSGVGIASLCLATRVGGVSITGIEIDPDLVRTANENAALNKLETHLRFHEGDAAHFQAQSAFTQVFFNPPFYPETGQASPSAERERAKKGDGALIADWAGAGLAALAPGGTLTIILRADRAEECVKACAGCRARYFPLFPKQGEQPKRLILRLVKGEVGAPLWCKGLVLHQEDGKPTDEAEAVLRHGMGISFSED